MPSITNANLTLTTTGINTTITIIYKAHFTPLERFLASKGLRFIEKIAVHSADFIENAITYFPSCTVAVSDGPIELILDRNRSITVQKSLLQGDAAHSDTDEINCRITLEPVGLPTTVEQVTEQEVLAG